MPDSTPPILARREHCPGCQWPATGMLHSEALDSPAITRYLHRHYQGRAGRAFAGHDYQLARCDHCSLAFQVQVPTAALLEEIYDCWLPATERAVVAARFGLDDYRYLAEQVEFMLAHFRLPPGELKALDFGFGWAEWTRMAAAYGVDACGAELSQVRIDYATSIGIRVVDADALPSQEFHFINTEQVFEHLLEPGRVLRQLAAALRPGGLLKISVPDCARAIRKLRRAGAFAGLSDEDIMPIAPFEHINSFTHDSLVVVGREAGLAPLRASLRALYNSSSGWMEPKAALKALARPLYRHVYPKTSFVYFVRPG